MTKRLCENVKVLAQPFLAKKKLFLTENNKNKLENTY